MVEDPGGYPWSSYRHHALGARNDLVQSHELYRALGEADGSRQEAYRALFRSELDAEALAEIRQAAGKGLPLGGKRFRQEIAQTLGGRVDVGRRGRPRRGDAEGIDGGQIGIKL